MNAAIKGEIFKMKCEYYTMLFFFYISRSCQFSQPHWINLWSTPVTCKARPRSLWKRQTTQFASEQIMCRMFNTVRDEQWDYSYHSYTYWPQLQKIHLAPNGESAWWIDEWGPLKVRTLPRRMFQPAATILCALFLSNLLHSLRIIAHTLPL